MGRVAEEQGCSRGGSRANRGSGVDGAGLSVSQSSSSAQKDTNIQTFVNNMKTNHISVLFLDRLEWSNLALPWDRETVMETEEMGSMEKGNLKETAAMDLEDKETEKERGGKDPDPGALGRAHSESHCCTSEQGRGPYGHPGYPKSGIFRRKQVKGSEQLKKQHRAIFKSTFLFQTYR